VILSNMARMRPRSTDSSTPGVPSASCTCVEAKISKRARYRSLAMSAYENQPVVTFAPLCACVPAATFSSCVRW